MTHNHREKNGIAKVVIRPISCQKGIVGSATTQDLKDFLDQVDVVLGPLVEGALVPLVEGALGPLVEGALVPLGEGALVPLPEGALVPLPEGALVPLPEVALARLPEEALAPLPEEALGRLPEEGDSIHLGVVLEEAETARRKRNGLVLVVGLIL